MVNDSETKRIENYVDFVLDDEMKLSTEVSTASYSDHTILDLEYKNYLDIKISEKIGGKRMGHRMNTVINSQTRYFKTCKIQIKNILNSVVRIYPVIVRNLLSSQKLEKIAVYLQKLNGLKQREKYLCAILILQGRAMGSYVDKYEILEHFNIKKGFMKIFSEVKFDKEFKFKFLNAGHKYTAVKSSVITLIHSVADEFNLSTRAEMLQFSETSEINVMYKKIRNRIDKQLTYFIIMKFNLDINVTELADFLLKQGPIHSNEENENLRKAYSRIKKLSPIDKY